MGSQSARVSLWYSGTPGKYSNVLVAR